MKAFIKIITCAAALSSVVFMCSCNSNDGGEDAASAVVSTTSSESSVTESKSNSSKTGKIKNSLQAIDYKDSDKLAGVWRIENLPSFAFMFNGNGDAYLIYDNVGFIGTYSYENNGSESLFKTQLVFGLDGSYSYKLSADNQTATLTQIITTEVSGSAEGATTVSTGDVVEMKRIDESDLNYVVAEDKDAELDKAILGAWKAEDGTTVYFQDNGIMYMNEYGVKFTYSNYSANGKEIKSTYKMKEKKTDTYSYFVDGDTLNIDGYSYEKIDVSELK